MAWNKRIAKRRTLVFYLEVFEQSDGRLIGRIGDLTEHGMLLLNGEKLEADSVHDVSIAVPPEIMFPVTSIELTCTVKWAKPDKNPSLWSMGCHFGSLDERQQHLIQSLIEELGFADNHLSQRITFD